MQFEVYVMPYLGLFSNVTLGRNCNLFLQMVKFVMGLTCHAPGWEASHLSEICPRLFLKNALPKHISEDLSFVSCISSKR
jgi:hypothetical protein